VVDAVHVLDQLQNLVGVAGVPENDISSIATLFSADVFQNRREMPLAYSSIAFFCHIVCTIFVGIPIGTAAIGGDLVVGLVGVVQLAFFVRRIIVRTRISVRAHKHSPFSESSEPMRHRFVSQIYLSRSDKGQQANQYQRGLR